MSYIPPFVTKLSAVGTQSSFSVPPSFLIDRIQVVNNTASAVTGGLKFGTTSGGTDVVLALAVGANVLTPVADAALLKNMFSKVSSQTVFVDTVTLWNGANVDISVYLLPF